MGGLCHYFSFSLTPQPYGASIYVIPVCGTHLKSLFHSVNLYKEFMEAFWNNIPQGVITCANPVRATCLNSLFHSIIVNKYFMETILVNFAHQPNNKLLPLFSWIKCQSEFHCSSFERLCCLILSMELLNTIIGKISTKYRPSLNKLVKMQYETYNLYWSQITESKFEKRSSQFFYIILWPQ